MYWASFITPKTKTDEVLTMRTSISDTVEKSGSDRNSSGPHPFKNENLVYPVGIQSALRNFESLPSNNEITHQFNVNNVNDIKTVKFD
jgi:hypothetical protein